MEKIQKKNMPICMLIWDYWPGREGGAQRQCRKLSKALSDRGIRILVITQRTSWLGKRSILDRDIPIVRLGLFAPLAAIAIWIHKWKIRWSKTAHTQFQATAHMRQWGITTPFWWLARFSFMIAVKRYIAKNRRGLSLIHVHELNWIAGFASRLGAETGLPVVCKAATLPCLTPLGPDVPWRSALLHWRLQIHFIALNSEMAAELKAADINAARIHVIPNGVEIPSEQASPQDNSDVLFIANFTQGTHLKAYDVLLKAWDLVRIQNRQTRLIILGGGDKRPWQKFALDLGCEDSISFKGFSDKLDGFYRRAAMFVLPSRREGISNALLEAQSWGIPAVVSAIPGNLAVVSHGQNGLVVPVNNAQELAESILRLLNDPALRAELGKEARRRMIEEFSITAVAARIHALYQALTAADP